MNCLKYRISAYEKHKRFWIQDLWNSCELVWPLFQMRGKWKFIELQRSVMRSGVDTFQEVDPSKDSNRHFQECDLCKVVPCLRDLGLPFIWVKVWVGNNEETGTKIWDLCAENYIDRNLIILVRIWVGKKDIDMKLLYYFLYIFT